MTTLAEKLPAQIVKQQQVTNFLASIRQAHAISCHATTSNGSSQEPKT